MLGAVSRGEGEVEVEGGHGVWTALACGRRVTLASTLAYRLVLLWVHLLQVGGGGWGGAAQVLLSPSLCLSPELVWGGVRVRFAKRGRTGVNTRKLHATNEWPQPQPPCQWALTPH